MRQTKYKHNSIQYCARGLNQFSKTKQIKIIKRMKEEKQKF